MACFSDSWKYVNAHLSGKCRCRVILDAFGEADIPAEFTSICSDVCENQAAYQIVDYEEFKILDDVLKQVGSKGEVKISEWVCGSKVSWTNEFHKSALSFWNHRWFLEEISKALSYSLVSLNHWSNPVATMLSKQCIVHH